MTIPEPDEDVSEMRSSVTLPFDGFRVVDLSERASGAFAARLFGDFGADVILAEPPEGDPLRGEPPFLGDVAGPERSVVHAYLNWNKRSVVCDRTSDIGDLLAGADVVVTDAHPVADARWPGSLAQLHPHAVHLSITPHGLSSPLSGRPGNDLTASARSGWSSVNGYRDEPPLQMPGHQASYIGGVAGFVAAAASLLRPTTRGQEPELIDVSELEAFALTVHPWGVAAVYEGATSGGGPDRRPRRGEPGPLYDAADGQLSLAVAYFRRWPDAMRALGLPELADREDLRSDVARHTRDLSEVTAGIVRKLPSLQRWSVFHALAALRCPVGVVQGVDELLGDPQLAARHSLVDTAIEGRTVRAPGPVARFEPAIWRLSTPAPRLGEGPQRSPARRGGASEPSEWPPARPSTGPLDGVRVLSFGQAWSGAFATEILALLGADVVQISSLRRHDSWRRAGAGVPKGLVDPRRVQHPLNTQGLYNSVNLNKRDVTLDLEQDEGRDLLWRLLPRFSILVDNFRPTVLPSWGVTVEKLQSLRPGMIWASLSGYGSDGPYGRYPAIGTTIEPMGGISSVHGYEGDPGMNTGGLYPDPVAGYLLAASVVAAIHHRDHTSQAQRIDLSMMEAMTIVCGDEIAGYDATQRPPRPMGNHHRRVAPHNNYAARDGQWLALAAEDEAAWVALVTHIGDARLLDGRFATMSSRKANEATLDAILAEWCAGQDADRAEATLGMLGVSAARVIPLQELYSRPDPNLVASGFVTAVDHPEAGTTWLPGRPWKLPRESPSPVVAAPCVGQHSREVLTAELGIDAEEYAALVAAGVTGTLHDTRDTGSKTEIDTRREHCPT